MATAATSVFELFKSNKHCDVTFKVKCGNIWSYFPAHKIVLSIWSPFWANKFRKDSNAFDSEIEILDICSSTFYAFLSYLYDSKKVLEENINDVKFVLSIYQVAIKYQVQKLKSDCCEILNSSSPNKTNVFELLDAAVLLNSDALKGQCFRVLQYETEEILNFQDVNSVTPSMVETFLQLPSLWLSSEYELLTWVFKWAKSYCSLQNVNIPREVTSPLLPYLNFTALKSKEFAILVNNHREFFNDAECFDIFMKINLSESAESSARISSRLYNKPIENAMSVMLGNSLQELPYSINNLTSISADTPSIPSSTEELVHAVNAETNTTTILNNSSVDYSTSTIDICSIPTDDKETMTDVAIDASIEVTILTSLQSSIDNVAMDTRDDTVNDNSPLPSEIDTSPVIEMAEIGQSNAPIIKTIDEEPGISWESLEPPLHIKKIKKKKIVKSYLLPDGKSLSNIGKWDPKLESPLKFGDIKSLSSTIEKQQCHPVATERPPTINFPLFRSI